MQLEMSSPPAPAFRPPFYNLRWSAVFAGLVVLAAVDLLLLLLGGSAGLALANAGVKASEGTMVMAASFWNAFSMVAASIAGGYVAARASGMRRTPDGVLHGVLAWGMAMVVAVLFATSAGVALSELFAAERPAVAAVPLDIDQRMALADILEQRLGISGEQAHSLVDQIAILERGNEAVADPRQALRAASTISGWLSTAILLSLAGAIGGGVLGSRGTRRSAGKELRRAPPPDTGTAASAAGS